MKRNHHRPDLSLVVFEVSFRTVPDDDDEDEDEDDDEDDLP